MSTAVSEFAAELDVPDNVDEQEFFSDSEGVPTVVDHDDLVRTVEAYDASEIPHLKERARYWLYRPYSFVVVYENTQEDEHRYFVVEPTLNDTEQAILAMLTEKVPNSIDTRSAPLSPSKQQRITDIRRKAREILQRYRYVEKEGSASWLSTRITKALHSDTDVDADRDGDTLPLSEEQVDRLLYYLVRDFINYDKIDPLRHDVNVEDISCNGPNEQVFVDHATHGEIVTNISFTEAELDQFVKNLAGKAGKGISKRQPEVDARLPDGSRAKLILGEEINEKGSSFTIRQFKEVPFTPVDLVTWRTFSLDQMAYLWLAIEHGKSGIIAGGTSSGKTTTMNACSLFMPGNKKLVTIEDTPELKLPQANWVSHTTRDAFHGQDDAAYEAYDLLRGALRENPDYLIMGEVRGEESSNEGKALFQIMSTGHWTYTTFHADSPQELINRFTTDPIGVSPTQFASLDFITIQRQRSIGGSKVRRAVSITEVGEHDKDQGATDVSTVYEWSPGDDSFHARNESTVLEEIRRENGWREADLDRELALRKTVLAYLIYQRINSYQAVAATLQAYMARPEKVLALIAKGELKDQLATILGKDYINIDIDEAQEARVPRPTPTEGGQFETYLERVLKQHQHLLTQFTDLDVDFGETDAAEEGLLITSPGIQQTPGGAMPEGAPTVRPQLAAGDPEGSRPGPGAGATEDVPDHLGLASGEFAVEGGDVQRMVETARKEFDDLYDEPDDDGPFSDIIGEEDEIMDTGDLFASSTNGETGEQDDDTDEREKIRAIVEDVEGDDVAADEQEN